MIIITGKDKDAQILQLYKNFGDIIQEAFNKGWQYAEERRNKDMTFEYAQMKCAIRDKGHYNDTDGDYYVTVKEVENFIDKRIAELKGE